MRIENTFIYTKIAVSIFILLCIFNLNSTDAQSIRGKVYDQYKIPLIGAYIENVNSDHPHHTHSRELGDFILEDVHVGDTLQVTFFGFENQKIIIENADKELVIILDSSDNTQEAEKPSKFSCAVLILTTEQILQLQWTECLYGFTCTRTGLRRPPFCDTGNH